VTPIYVYLLYASAGQSAGGALWIGTGFVEGTGPDGTTVSSSAAVSSEPVVSSAAVSSEPVVSSAAESSAAVSSEPVSAEASPPSVAVPGQTVEAATSNPYEKFYTCIQS